MQRQLPQKSRDDERYVIGHMVLSYNRSNECLCFDCFLKSCQNIYLGIISQDDTKCIPINYSRTFKLKLIIKKLFLKPGCSVYSRTRDCRIHTISILSHVSEIPHPKSVNLYKYWFKSYRTSSGDLFT